MKKLLLHFIFLIHLFNSSFSQGTWTQKLNLGGSARFGAVGFSIGAKGYIGTGWQNGSGLNDFWEYNSTTNIWTQKANFGGAVRCYAVGFSVGTKGYIGTGINGSTSYKDFWEWDQSTNIWTKKSDFGGTARYNAVGISIGAKGYIGTGNDGTYKKDFWEYNPSTDLWTQKTNFGGAARYWATGFSIGTKGYIGTGRDAAIKNDFWEYDQISNTWIQKNNFGGSFRSGAIGFSIGTKGYVGMGWFNNDLQDFWEWDQTSDTWTQKANFGGGTRNESVGFSIGNKGYAGTGESGGTGSGVNDFWEFNFLNPQPICVVTVDSSSQNNVIAWDKPAGAPVDSFIVYREVTTNNYQRIGAVSYDSLSVFVDTARSIGGPGGGDPNATSWRYKLAILDTFGNLSSKSPYHQSMFIQNSGSNFSWNHYEIEGQPTPVPSLSNYVFQRDNNSNGNWITIANPSASSTAYTDVAFPTYSATATWRVQTAWTTTCTPTIKNHLPMGAINTTRSNTFKTVAVAVNETSLENLVSIYPNPNNGNFTIDLKTINSKFVKIKMYNIFGQLLYEKTLSEKKTEMNLKLPQGIYQLILETEFGKANKKIIIQ